MRWTQSQAQDFGERGKVLLDVEDNRFLVPDTDALPQKRTRTLAAVRLLVRPSPGPGREFTGGEGMTLDFSGSSRTRERQHPCQSERPRRDSCS